MNGTVDEVKKPSKRKGTKSRKAILFIMTAVAAATAAKAAISSAATPSPQQPHQQRPEPDDKGSSPLDSDDNRPPTSNMEQKNDHNNNKFNSRCSSSSFHSCTTTTTATTTPSSTTTTTATTTTTSATTTTTTTKTKTKSSTITHVQVRLAQSTGNDPVATPAALVQLVNASFTQAFGGDLVVQQQQQQQQQSCSSSNETTTKTLNCSEKGQEDTESNNKPPQHPNQEQEEKEEEVIQRLTITEAEKLVNDGILLILQGQEVEDDRDEDEDSYKTETSTTTTRTRSRSILLGCCTVQVVPKAAAVDNHHNDDVNGVVVGEWGCLAVHVDYQNCGYGQLLLRAAERYLTDCCGCNLLQLYFLGFAQDNMTAGEDDNDHDDTKYTHRLSRWYTQRQGYRRYPNETVYFPAGEGFFPEKGVYLRADAVLLPFRKPADTWISSRYGLSGISTNGSMDGNIEQQPTAAAAAAIADFCNAAYRQGEEGIFTPDSVASNYDKIRLTPADVQAWMQDGSLLVLWERIVENDSRVDGGINEKVRPIGCVKVYLLETTQDDRTTADIIGEWGCLAVHPDYQGQGYATRLASAAEHYLQYHFHCTVWQLQLLTPMHWKHPHKERLRRWYQESLGYRPAVAGTCVTTLNAHDNVNSLDFIKTNTNVLHMKAGVTLAPSSLQRIPLLPHIPNACHPASRKTKSNNYRPRMALHFHVVLDSLECTFGLSHFNHPSTA